MWELGKGKKQQKPKDLELLESFVRDEVKYRQMTKHYNVSLPTIRKRMNNLSFKKYYCDKTKPQKIVLLMDTTYFGKKYGYMIFRAWFPKEKKGKNLLWYKVKYETNDKYREGYRFLLKKGRKIVSIVCDGRQGLLGGFGDIPTQMCIYHMKQIITRYLTKKPKLKQNISLKNIATCIGDYPRDDIEFALKVRYEDSKKWLEERNEKGNYRHNKTRKAYRSIKRKLHRCYTFVRYSDLGIPSTNNSLEAINSHLKTKIRIHRGLKENNKDDFTNYYLYIS